MFIHEPALRPYATTYKLRIKNRKKEIIKSPKKKKHKKLIKQKCRSRKSTESIQGGGFQFQIGASVAGIVVAAEDRDSVVEEEEDEDEDERDADRRSADAVDGVGLAGGEDGGDEGSAFGGEELDGEEEDDGEEEQADGAEQLRDEVGERLALVAEQCRHHHHQHHHYRQDNRVRRSGAPFFNHLDRISLQLFSV